MEMAETSVEDAAADGTDTVRAAALSFIAAASDGAIPMPDDDDEEASGEAKRQFGSDPRTAWQEWEAFCERVETGKAAPSCVIDFAYTDGGNLRGPETQLERCICFHDPDEILTVVHVHEVNVRMAQGALPPKLVTYRGSGQCRRRRG